MTSNPKPAAKHDAEKERFDLIPPEELWTLAEVYTHGAEKYEDRNWEKGLKWGRVFAAVMRHLWRFWAGEEDDAESGLPHLAHAAWRCLTLLNYTRHHRELDDRPKERRTS